MNNEALRPVIAVRNIGKDATTVAASIPYSLQDGKTGKITLPQLSLAPGEIKLFDASNPQLRQQEIATAGLEIEYKSAPGSVIASVSSVSQSGNQVFALPLKDPQGGMSSTGGYPWFIKQSSSTVVSVKNVTGSPQDFILEIVYPGGRWGNLRKLPANQTLALDLRSIRDSQEKDSNGDIMPSEATAGHVSWGVLGSRNKVLIGRAQTVDTVAGLASTYECQCLCPPNLVRGRLVPESASDTQGSTESFVAQEYFVNCYNVATDWCNVPWLVNFRSSNPGIATVDSSGLATAIQPGSTIITGSWETQYWQMGLEGWCEPVFYQPMNGSATYQVQCRVPTGETIASSGWLDSRHLWSQTIMPASVSWSVRQIRERDFDAPSDSCWYEGSGFDPVEGVTRLDPITLDGNVYEDKVGWIPLAVTRYRSGRAARSLPMPCGYVVLQEMQMLCPPNSWNRFTQNVLVGTIGVTTVGSQRSNINGPVNSVTRTYP